MCALTSLRHRDVKAHIHKAYKHKYTYIYAYIIITIIIIIIIINKQACILYAVTHTYKHTYMHIRTQSSKHTRSNMQKWEGRTGLSRPRTGTTASTIIVMVMMTLTMLRLHKSKR